MSTTASEAARAPTVAAISRALEVLTLFAESGEPTLGVTEISQRLELSKAVVHRILSSFRAKGFVELDEGTRRYSLGARVLQLGLAYLDGVDVRSIARPALEELVAATDETATLSIRSGDSRVYIDQVTPPRDVKMVVTIGQMAPLHAGSSSKAFLAFLPPEEQAAYLAGHPLDALTELTLTDPAKLRRELAAIRKRGYARSLGERLAGSASVAAPVLGHDGTPVAVMSVCGPLERFREEADDAAKLLLAATTDLSRRMGHRG